MPFSTLGNDATTTLYALRAPTSGSEPQILWTVDLGPGQAGGPTGNSPVIGPDGTIYALSGGGRLNAIKPDGSVLWTAQAGPAVKVSPAVAQDGTVYTSSLDGKLYALAPPAGSGAQGSVKWTFDFGQHLGPTPLVATPVAGPPTRGQDAIGSASSATIGPDGTIYIGANNSNFYAIDPSGQQKWLFEAERELAGIWTTAALSSDASTVYFGANKGGIYAVNTRDGSRRWQFPIFASVYSSAILDARGMLYTGSSIGHVFGIDTTNGEGFADYDAQAAVWTAPALRPDGTLVVADRNGVVRVLGD
jgi:outer membrane protein assembly factor BamB